MKRKTELLANMTIRLEQPTDWQRVEYLTREAFWNVNVPGCDEHYLAHTLRQAQAFIPELDFVVEVDDQIVGNIMHARASIVTGDGTEHPVLTFGPVSVLPAYQGQGIGSALIRHSLALARKLGFGIVVIYGDPDFYSRLGFEPAEKYGIRGQGELFNPALQILELIPGAIQGICGSFAEGEAYHVDEAAAAEFDKHFPFKVKEETLSQAKFRELLSQAHK